MVGVGILSFIILVTSGLHSWLNRMVGLKRAESRIVVLWWFYWCSCLQGRKDWMRSSCEALAALNMWWYVHESPTRLTIYPFRQNRGFIYMHSFFSSSSITDKMAAYGLTKALRREKHGSFLRQMGVAVGVILSNTEHNHMLEGISDQERRENNNGQV